MLQNRTTKNSVICSETSHKSRCHGVFVMFNSFAVVLLSSYERFRFLDFGPVMIFNAPSCVLLQRGRDRNALWEGGFRHGRRKHPQCGWDNLTGGVGRWWTSPPLGESGEGSCCTLRTTLGTTSMDTSLNNGVLIEDDVTAPPTLRYYRYYPSS